MLSYLLPLLIAYTGGKNIYGDGRGVLLVRLLLWVSSSKQTFRCLSGQWRLGATGRLVNEKFDQTVQPKIKAGFEMLVNNFSAGILGFVLHYLAIL